MKDFSKIKKHIESFGYKVTAYDFKRPWGGFLVIDESQAEKFANQFFDGISLDDLKISGKLSPKILIINSNSRYHGNITVDVLKSGGFTVERSGLLDLMTMTKML